MVVVVIQVENKEENIAIPTVVVVMRVVARDDMGWKRK